MRISPPEAWAHRDTETKHEKQRYEASQSKNTDEQLPQRTLKIRD